VFLRDSGFRPSKQISLGLVSKIPVRETSIKRHSQPIWIIFCN
jgi:hypothetical protein